MKTFIFVTITSLLVIASPLLAFVGHTQPVTNGLALVIAPLWGPPIGEVLAVAEMMDAHPGRAPMGAFVVINDADSLNTLYESGAWLVLNGEKILELC